jgi:hypothetical protein
VQGGLYLFSKVEDWKTPVVFHLLKDVSKHMSPHDPRDVKSSIYDLIKAMVYSDKVFRHTNLAALILFLQDVGLELDGSARLTDLPTALWKNPSERT